ncbi:hypothetical protein MVEN_01189300 [Mycena venus]|uniref:Uncharacterized protein n=1 Tax=Mycena venus TaxID=2733690 RepID=A0A8H7CY54_9AGAR|nr:hypothetical protein MVEN_01189300 [Mycena venus]
MLVGAAVAGRAEAETEGGREEEGGSRYEREVENGYLQWAEDMHRRYYESPRVASEEGEKTLAFPDIGDDTPHAPRTHRSLRTAFPTSSPRSRQTSTSMGTPTPPRPSTSSRRSSSGR